MHSYWLRATSEIFGLFYRVAESSLPPALIQLLLDTNNYTSTTRCLLGFNLKQKRLADYGLRWLSQQHPDFCLSWSCTGHLLCFNISLNLSSWIHLSSICRWSPALSHLARSPQINILTKSHYHLLKHFRNSRASDSVRTDSPFFSLRLILPC